MSEEKRRIFGKEKKNETQAAVLSRRSQETVASKNARTPR